MEADGSYKDGSMVCRGISVLDSLEQHFCQWYKPNDPYCSIFKEEPPCSDTLEYRSIACTEPNTVGVINQSRNFYCKDNAYGAWITTSENCSPAPATCFETTETMDFACDPDHNGQITKTRRFSCATPYGPGTFTPWIETSNACVKKLTNPTNVTSPLSPMSPMKDEGKEQVEKMMVPKVEMNDFSSPESLQQSLQIMPELIPMPKVEVPKPPKPEVKEQPKAEPKIGATKQKPEVKIEPELETKEKEPEIKSIKVPKGKSLVPGFGLTMSLDLLNAPVQMQEIQLNDILNLIQEQDYARQQNFLADFITENPTNDAFSRIANTRWRSLLYDNPLQSDGFNY